MEASDLKTAVDAAMHEWQTLPRWKRIEIERDVLATFVLNKVKHLVLDEKRCHVCSGSGIVAHSQMEYCTDECYNCKGTRTEKSMPTIEMVKELIQ